MCRTDATLQHADNVLRLLIDDLRSKKSNLTEVLLEQLKVELEKKKEQTVYAAFAVLDNLSYDSKLESEIGQGRLSESELFYVLEAAVDHRRLISSIGGDSANDPSPTVRNGSLIPILCDAILRNDRA